MAARGPRIRSDGRTWTLAGWYGADLPLVPPAELKRQALAAADAEYEPERSGVVGLLDACTFEYEVVPGKDSVSWVLGVVIRTDAGRARRLADHSDPAVLGFYRALLAAAGPDLGSERVVADG